MASYHQCMLFYTDRLNLKRASEYNYLSHSDCLVINDVDDARKFQMLMEALNTVRICKEDQEHAFEMLAAVLWLGNISFQVVDNENHVQVVADEGKIYLLGLVGCYIFDDFPATNVLSKDIYR
ncbi:unnamed protein product [Ilex paraguariensis]|uniref:Myosin motor domain-containing protein n=1 Tax=Ilex paraguariensis TaxID=185542 RepID=A0ABC8UPS2_9AQUA